MARSRLHAREGSGGAYKVALYLDCAGLDWEQVGVCDRPTAKRVTQAGATQ